MLSTSFSKSKRNALFLQIKKAAIFSKTAAIIIVKNRLRPAIPT